MSSEEMQVRKAETYRKILDTSWDIAVKEGLEALSIRKVAATLHFAPNNLYHYFPTKADLLYQLKKDAYEWTFIHVLSDLPHVSARELMDVISHRLLHTVQQAPERFAVMTSDLIMDSDEPMDKKINDITAEQVQRGIDAGEFREVDPLITATNVRMALISFMRWTAMQKNMSQEQSEAYLDNFLSTLFDGISSEKERKKS